MTTAFETIHYGWRFYRHGPPYEFIFSWVNTFTQKLAKVPRNYHLHSNPSLVFEEHCCTKTFHLFLYAHINLVCKFHIVLFRSFLPQFIYLFTFWYSVYLGVNLEPSRFFIKTSKVLMRLNVVFLEGLQAQNVLIMFLFSMKHSYLLTAKTTQDVKF